MVNGFGLYFCSGLEVVVCFVGFLVFLSGRFELMVLLLGSDKGKCICLITFGLTLDLYDA